MTSEVGIGGDGSVSTDSEWTDVSTSDANSLDTSGPDTACKSCVEAVIVSSLATYALVVLT